MASAEEIQQMLAAMQSAFVDALEKQRQEQKKASEELQSEILSLKEEVESICSKSATLSPRVALTPPTSQGSQQPIEEILVSGNGSTPASQLPPQSPPRYKRLSERLPDPTLFTGKRTELPKFLYQLENKLIGNADRYPNDEDKLRVTECEGPSLRHGPVIWLAGEPSRTARIFQNYRIGYINRYSHPVAFLSLALAIMNSHSV
jgi:hypothetical protein